MGDILLVGVYSGYQILKKIDSFYDKLAWKILNTYEYLAGLDISKSEMQIKKLHQA